MKKALFLFFLFLPTTLFNQVVISYIQPDIVAPGMNSYIEFIAPYNAYGNFGADGTYYNELNSPIKIEVVNPADIWKVTFGPVVVSWQGRLISTQVFAHPALKPNSWDWSLLSNEFKIKVRVNKNGVLSNEVDLYIVKPFPFGDRNTSSERILGEGTLGKRSPRGAMIVDRMILANAKYFVSTNDTDPNTPGNQGYLPFILISKGSIVGGNNTIISVDGGTDGGQQRLQDAGPGGGGGGGRFYDAGWFCDNSRNGDDGGNGFVGGGAGGRNNSSILVVSNSMKLPGVGSFEDTSKTPARGYSLNGIPPSYKDSVYESAGGGTGHPFGRSGEHCNDGNKCIPSGGYGGGSGVKHNTPGGSGGYATDGGGNNNSGGKAIGNRMIVPLAGGSGGASGNPQSVCNFSGSGGGGGGALMIYAPEIRNVKISAKGAQGQNGVNSSNGGGGSGGAVITSAKIAVDNGGDQSIFIEGGKAGGGTNQYGGWGRVRRDAPIWNVFVGGAASVAETYYQGPTTDTTQFIKPLVPFTITGTKKFEDSLELWLKPETRPWTKVGTIPSGQIFWELQMLLDRTDSVYYFLAMQSVPNPEKINEYRSEPDFIMTQAAANVLILEKIPEFHCTDTLFTDTLLACDGQQVSFKAKIHNLGDADLILNRAYSVRGFISANVNNVVVPPFDSTEIIITYLYNKNQPLKVVDTLLIEHNDYWTQLSNPFPIAFDITLKELRLASNLHKFISPFNHEINLNNVKSYTINACLGETYKILASVQNATDTVLNLEQISTNNSNSSALILGNKKITPLDTATFELTILANTKGISKYYFYYKLLECDNIIDSLEIILNTKEAELTFLDSGEFPDTRIGNSNTKTIRLKNTGETKVYLRSISIDIIGSSDFIILGINPPIPDTLYPNDEIQITVRFAPTIQSNNINGQLLANTISTVSSCQYDILLPLKGMGIQANVFVSKYLIDFDTLYLCDNAFDTIYVKNPSNSTARFFITKPATIKGSPAFKIHSQPQTPIGLSPNDSVFYTIKFEQGYPGNHIAELTIYTDETGSEEIKVQIKGTKDTLNVEIIPNPINLGNVAVGQTVNTNFSIHNKGLLPLNLSNIKFANLNVQGTFNPTTSEIKPNQSLSVNLTILVDKKINPNELINITFEECQWETNENLVLNKLFSRVTTNSPINFGIVSGCEDTVKTILVANTGDAAFTLNSWTIEGVDRNLFEFRGQSLTLPADIQPGKDFQMLIAFTPLLSTNGNKQAYVKFGAKCNGEDTTIIVNLIGEKRSTAIAVPDNLNFGNRVINTFTQQIFTLKNEGLFPIQILSINTPRNYPNIFEIKPDYTGYILQPGESITFTISFTPTELIKYIDTLIIQTKYKNCEENIYVSLEGTGIPPRIMTLRLPRIELIDPRTENHSIPIFAKVENDTLLNYKIDTLEISFNRALFYPKTLQNGQILYKYIVNGKYLLGLQINNINLNELNKEVEIARLVGDVLLGNDTATTLEFSRIGQFDTERVQRIETTNGYLSIKVCREGGNRLLEVQNNPVGITISPIPITEDAEIKLKLLEIGYHKLELFNLNGNLIKEIASFIITHNEAKEKSLVLNIRDISNGVYLLKLTTPTSYVTTLIVVNK